MTEKVKRYIRKKNDSYVWPWSVHLAKRDDMVECKLDGSQIDTLSVESTAPAKAVKITEVIPENGEDAPKLGSKKK